jgi:hypothetical protein
MRLYSSHGSAASIDNDLLLCGRELVSRYTFEQPYHRIDYDLSKIVDACLVGDDAKGTAVAVCRRFKTSRLKYGMYMSAYPDFIESLFRVQPEVALDELVGDAHESIHAGGYSDRKTPLDTLDPSVLIGWARREPSTRFARVAAGITLFKKNKEEGHLAWTPLALQILDLAPDPSPVLAGFRSRLTPRSWSGSLVDLLEARRDLTRPLLSHPEFNNRRLGAGTRCRTTSDGRAGAFARAADRREFRISIALNFSASDYITRCVATYELVVAFRMVLTL